MLSSIELIWRTCLKELLGIVGGKKPSSCLGWGPAAAMRKYWLFFLGDDCKIIDLVLLVPFKCMLICRGICYLFVLCLWVRFLCWNIGFFAKTEPIRPNFSVRFLAGTSEPTECSPRTTTVNICLPQPHQPPSSLLTVSSSWPIRSQIKTPTMLLGRRRWRPPSDNLFKDGKGSFSWLPDWINVLHHVLSMKICFINPPQLWISCFFFVWTTLCSWCIAAHSLWVVVNIFFYWADGVD